MKRRIRIIFILCSLLVILAAVWSAFRSFRPSGGKPYEMLSAVEAKEYMSFEKRYCIVDVREKEEYDREHVKGARNLPIDQIVKRADQIVPERDMMLYVYGSDSGQSCAAAQKLCDLGYTSVTETGSMEDWIRLEQQA